MTLPIYTLDGTAKRLHKSSHDGYAIGSANIPGTRHDRPLFDAAGRTLLFTEQHMDRIVESLAMPVKIIPPRNFKTKNLYIRGTYLGVRSGQELRN